MAPRTQKKQENIAEKIITAYKDVVLTAKEMPASVYAFAKQTGISIIMIPTAKTLSMAGKAFELLAIAMKKMAGTITNITKTAEAE